MATTLTLPVGELTLVRLNVSIDAISGIDCSAVSIRSSIALCSRSSDTEGLDIYIPFPKAVSSHTSTVERKLCIIRPIPTVKEIAMVSVAIAIDVRLSEFNILLVAIEPIIPNEYLNGEAIIVSAITVIMGIKSAPPNTRRKSPVKPSIRLVLGVIRIIVLTNKAKMPVALA